jgi:hypothetical protein
MATHTPTDARERTEGIEVQILAATADLGALIADCITNNDGNRAKELMGAVHHLQMALSELARTHGKGYMPFPKWPEAAQ